MKTVRSTVTMVTMRILDTVIMAINRRLILRGRLVVARTRGRARRSRLVTGQWADHGSLVGPLSG
jgi:hypothetical protein